MMKKAFFILIAIFILAALSRLPACDAFDGCRSLVSIEIPNSVKSIAYHAFDLCTLKIIYFGGTEAEWNAVQKSLGTIPSSVKVYFIGEW